MKRAVRWGGLIVVVAMLAALVGYGLRPAADAGPSVADRAAQPGGAYALLQVGIHTDDLPPPGTRSLFDHWVAQVDGLPYPFEDLMTMLAQPHPQGTPPLQLMIPFGRSLLKGQADFAAPRILVATDFEAANTPANLGLLPRGQLFLGFTEQADEIEVISYNEAAGRFEFQLVQDYRADGRPRIVYARRAICLTCHQGGGPIFPQRPWNETNAHPAIGERIRAAQPDLRADYRNVPATLPLSAPERFDELADTGLFLPVTQAVWISGCGLTADGDPCRRHLLNEALRYAWDPGGYDPTSGHAQALVTAQRRDWPPGGIPVPDGDLRNRDPLAGHTGLLGRLRGLFVDIGPRGGARSNEDLAAFEALPKLPSALDPLSPRPPRRQLQAEDLDGVYGLARLFSSDDLAALEHHSKGRFDAVETALATLPPETFAAAPVSRVTVMQALLPALGGTAPGYCCRDTAALSPPQPVGVPPLAIGAGSVLLHFETYCFACHRGNPAARLDFMSGDSEAEVLARIADTPAIRDALDWARYAGTDKAALLMPPADAPQHARMLAAPDGGAAKRAAMREAVPSLFGDW